MSRPDRHSGTRALESDVPPAAPRRDFTAIATALRDGRLVVDRVFDDVYPLAVRRASSVHWTPVEVGVRGARLLAVEPGARILDIGAGVGKFCIVAAAASGHAMLHGIEQRPHLVDIARDAAAKVGVRVAFSTGTIDELDPSGFDGAYLFNPFGENLCPRSDHIDDTVELSEDRFRRDLRATDRFLRAARPGMRVVTYCGFGGQLPPEYSLVSRERCAGALELWVKGDSGAAAAAQAGSSRRLGGGGPKDAPWAALRDRSLATALEDVRRARRQHEAAHAPHSTARRPRTARRGGSS